MLTKELLEFSSPEELFNVICDDGDDKEAEELYDDPNVEQLAHVALDEWTDWIAYVVVNIPFVSYE